MARGSAIVGLRENFTCFLNLNRIHFMSLIKPE